MNSLNHTKLAILPLLSVSLLLLSACKPAEPPKIVATDTGKSGPGAQTIKGGNVTMTFGADGKPLSYTRGNGSNLINTADPGPGFVLTTGAGPTEKKVPLSSLESQNGKLIATGADNSSVTFAVNAGINYISFRIERIENIPENSEPILSFRANFKGVGPEAVALDYMTNASGLFATRRCFVEVAWPYLWKRGDKDPLGGFAFFIPSNDDDQNEALLRIWTEEKLPHPKIDGQWTYERAKQWVKDWEEKFRDTHTLTISAEKPEDLDVLFEYAKKLNVNRIYMHTDTWRGAYWVYDRDPLSINKAVFPRGEADLKAFNDKLKANNMDAMMHTICYGIGPEGSKYLGKGKKADKRLANWGKGKLEKPISATDKTILFRPDPGVKVPVNSTNAPMGSAESQANSYGGWWKFTDVLIGDEIVPCKFTNTDQPVWTLTECQRGASATAHDAGTMTIGLLKAYGQNYYPSSMTDMSEETAREYAEFFNRLGIQHHEYDGAEDHCDVPWGFSKWSMFVYQNTDHLMTSNTSGGSPNPWDLVYRFKSGGVSNMTKRGGGSAALALDRDGRLSTSPIENHFTLARGAASNSTGFAIGKPEPMFGLFPKTIQEHGLATLVAEQYALWRELAPKLTPELRKQISGSIYHDKTPNALDAGHPVGKTIFEARRSDGGYEIQPFCIMVRGNKEDVEWKTVQEFGPIMPRQYVAPGMRLKLENPYQRQSPQFIIRFLNGYSDGAVATTAGPAVAANKDMEGYMIGAGVNAEHPAPTATPAATPAPADKKADATAIYKMQPKAAQITNPGRHQFKDIESALEVSFDNSNKDEVFLPSGLPSYTFKANPQNARGVGMTVTGDGSGAYLIVQVGPSKDYVVPIDFTGKKDIVIPIGEAARSTGTWGMRYHTKRAGYGPVSSVSIGFGRVMAKTYPKVLVENLRMLGETPSSIKNPVIHAGLGTLTIQGEVKSDQYLWYQGGDKVGVYDLNWHPLATLPVVLQDYAVGKGFSEFWIDGECGNPPPWLDVQFITKGDVIPLKKEK